MLDQKPNPRASRWISVIFMQGEEADEVLGTIDRSGAAAAIEYLRQWDYGDETTDGALTNGYVYEGVPAGSTDRIFENLDSPYALIYSAPFGHVSLLRRYSAEPEPGLVSVPGASATRSARAHHATDTWAAARGPSMNKAGHAVAL